MARRIFRNAAVAVLLAAAALVCGCGGGGGTNPVVLAGDWTGSLGISYTGGGGASGTLTLNLDQQDDFVSGIAQWSPVGVAQSVGGPIDGTKATLYLHFLCASKRETATLTGAFDGTTLTITGGTGTACTGGGATIAGGGAASSVSGASGALTRSVDHVPL